MGSSLLGGLLAEEKKTLSGVCSPGDVLVSKLLLLLTTEVARQSLALDRFSAKPEKFLLEDETPSDKMLAIDYKHKHYNLDVKRDCKA